MPIVAAYLSYLALALAVTLWVARTLHQSGLVFLVDAFHGNRELAVSVNRLLVVGFYLVSVGFVTLALSTTDQVTNARLAIEFVSTKIGQALLVLGCMHFFNLYVLNQLRKRAHDHTAVRPPAGWAAEGGLGKVLE
jgi:hypothetical protein